VDAVGGAEQRGRLRNTWSIGVKVHTKSFTILLKEAAKCTDLEQLEKEGRH